MCYKRRFLRGKANLREGWLVAVYNLHRIFWKGDTEVVRMLISVASLMWSFLLFWPGDTFARPTYTLMAEFGSEHVWGTLFLVQGLAGVFSILYNCKKICILVLDSILGCILWTGSCVAMVLSVYPPPAAISAEIIVAWFSWWLLLRLPIDK